MSFDNDLEFFRDFVRNTKWRFAKTYVETYPHEYSLDEWNQDDVFTRAISCIERYGVLEPFYTAQRKYLYVDDRIYWHMGDVTSPDPEDEPGLINRSWID